MIKVTFELKGGGSCLSVANEGETLLDVARRYNLDLEGACGGAMACSTCHVIVDKGWYAQLPLATVDECDILDLAPGLTRSSRLACQIKITEVLNGLVVALPK